MTVLTVTYHGSNEGMSFENCFKVTARDDIAKGLVDGIYDEDGNTELQRKCRGAMLDLEGIAKRLTELYFTEPYKADKYYKIGIVDIEATDHYMNDGESY